MMPIIFSIGSFNLYVFGLMVGIGYLLAVFIVWRRLRELSFQEEKMIDLMLLAGVVATIFSRLFYIFTNWSDFRFDVIRWLDINRLPGLSYSGAIVGLLLSIYWFCKKAKWDFWQISDEALFGILPWLVLAQIGSFLTGSGQGKATVMPWGVFFPGSLVRRQPVAIFYALGFLGLWVFLLRIEREWRFWSWCKIKTNGFLTLIFSGFLTLFNLLLALLKDNQIYLTAVELSVNLLGLLIAGGVYYVRSGGKIKISGKRKK